MASFRIAIACFLLAGCATDDADYGTAVSAVDVTAFALPPTAAAARAPIVRKYDAIDPTDLVPRGLLEDALAYFDINQALIPKQQYVVVVDFSRYSGKTRFWLVDMTSGAVETHKVAHGQNSDPDNDGYATTFGNVSGSLKSSLGYYLTGEIYDGTHPHSMRLDGLSPDGSPNGMADTNVRSRLVVMHEASYVSDANSSQQGRSDGCLALDPAIEAGVVDRIHDGSLIYAEIAALNPPVGRAMCGDGTCDGAETHASCPADCPDGGGSNGSGSGSDPGGSKGDDPMDPGGTTNDPGGCSAGGGAGLVIVLAFAGVRRRRETARSR